MYICHCLSCPGGRERERERDSYFQIYHLTGHVSSTCNISYWLLIHTSGSCYQISAHRLEQQTNNCQSSHLLCETCTKEFPSSLVLIEADGVFPFHMRSEDLHVRETGRGPCYGSSNTEQWGAMNAIMLLQVFLQVLKKQ